MGGLGGGGAARVFVKSQKSNCKNMEINNVPQDIVPAEYDFGEIFVIVWVSLASVQVNDLITESPSISQSH